MEIIQTAILYILLGLAVAVAMQLQGLCKWSLRGIFLFGAGVLAWPFFIPALIHSSHSTKNSGSGEGEEDLGDTRLSAAQRQLIAAIDSLDGTFAQMLAPELRRVNQLAPSLAAMKRRINEMDQLIAVRAQAEATTLDKSALQRSQVTTSRLQTLRDQTSEKFEQALRQLEEMSSTVILIRFAEHSEEEVADCLRDLSARVEGISEGILATFPKLV